MSYKFSKEELVKIKKISSLSKAQLKFISSIKPQISFINIGTLEKIKQIQRIPYDTIEKLKLNIPKIDTTALQKAVLEITNFHNQFTSAFDFNLISELQNTFTKIDIINKNYFKFFSQSSFRTNEDKKENETIELLNSISEDIEETLTKEDIENFSSIDDFNSIEEDAKNYNKMLSKNEIIALISVFFYLLLIFKKEWINQLPIFIKEHFGEAGIWVLARKEAILALIGICLSLIIDKDDK
ncbi:hypothetical protein [Fusobacterium hwasookii]|jgi:hypothetical protein|uniref:hypothetical protein n=1 Tax=Fusobacterium hwasookii TaxID=1583098 RepID=UPI000496D0A3|nr:hypothetical protein [Fusobacterium hwasookii]ALQ36892.1 hypothetical protein RN97_01420 [Fusobacterium hwasookii ChDC F300]